MHFNRSCSEIKIGIDFNGAFGKILMLNKNKQILGLNASPHGFTPIH